MAAELTLADVDGTIPGRAILVSLKLDYDTNPYFDVNVEGQHGCTDPFATCERTLLAIGDDFPDHVHTMVGNERAKYLAWKRRLGSMFSGDHSPAEYLAR